MERNTGELSQSLAQTEALPDINNHRKFVEASGIIFFSKDKLDKLYYWWVDYSKGDALSDRFKSAISGQLPEPESRDASAILGQRLKALEVARKGIINFVKAAEPKWGWTKPIFKAIDEMNEEQSNVEQAAALCEALNETKGEWRDETIMRRLVAQWAWEDFFNAAIYANLHYQADTGESVTTTGDIEAEKTEIIAALRKDVWDEKKIREQRKIYRKWKSMIIDNYDEETAYSLKLVWDSIRGKAAKSTSAIEILQAAERVLRDLDWEGAFEYTSDDLEDEE